MPEPEGHVVEVFRSFQGEGPLAGTPQVFVRFAGCDRACAFCDTEEARERSGEKTRIHLDGGKRWLRPNPWRAEDLAEALEVFSAAPLWLTGGEPLLQADFLARFLPHVMEKHPAGLETHSLDPQALRKVSSHLRWISADAKLPSSTGEPMDWDAFTAFLREGLGKGLYVKTVLTDATEAEEVRRLFGCVSGLDPAIPLFLQPVTPREGIGAPDYETLEALALEGLNHLTDVRVLPQVHRLAGWR
ncbi:MAG: 7-carboxy-7-deazaguanine synthase QueE [Planctomycetota bacterium]|jgi:organic radical activating enzyme